MPTRTTASLLRDKLLANLYRRAVLHRSPKTRVPGPPDNLIQQVSDRLGDSRLADLFIESQFAAMPEAWCLSRFNRPYPPASVCFGGECWRRYEQYIETGERKPTVEHH